jgi:epsilon-lactone hydrolase
MPSQEHEALCEAVLSMPFFAETLAETRANFSMLEYLFPVGEEIRCRAVTAGSAPAEWVMAPGVSDRRTVLYLHGGGYVLGSVATHRQLAARISAGADASVLLLDYRLAPEHPFPAAVDDAVDAYRWLLDQGRSAAELVIAGDSAGGGLAVATLLAARDGGLPLPAAAVCLSPWADLELVGPSMEGNATTDQLLGFAVLADMRDTYLGGRDPREPLASPIHADLAGLPPLYLQVSASECLLDDALRLAEIVTAAGGEVTVDRWDGLLHVFQLFATLPETTDAMTRIGDFIKARTR